MAFYDGTGLLSQKDINGETPEIYLCTSNRSARQDNVLCSVAREQMAQRQIPQIYAYIQI